MEKEQLRKIIKKSVEDVWYNRRSINPVEEQTELLTEALHQALSMSGVVGRSEQFYCVDCNYFSRKPLLVSGSTLHPKEILTPEQIQNALYWYDKHRNHVNGLVNGVSKFPPSLKEDKRDCRLWKPQHWKWFLEYYH